MLERLKNQSGQAPSTIQHYVGYKACLNLMNNLERMQVLPDHTNNAVIPAYDTFQGEDLSTERSWWSSMVFFLVLGLAGFSSGHRNLKSIKPCARQVK